MKYSKNFERDWKFYTRNLDVFNFAGKPAPEIVQDFGDGLDAKECFCIYDSTGELKPCVQAELLQSVLICKASVNLYIKLWASHIILLLTEKPDTLYASIGLLEIEQYLDSLNAPGWVMKAVINQAGKQKR